MSLDPHQILGVVPGAEPEVVDAAYRALMKKYHPDRWRGDAVEGREKAQAINLAYDAIKRGVKIERAEVDDEAASASDSLAAPSQPVRTGRNLAWATGISAAILAVLAMLTTTGR